MYAYGFLSDQCLDGMGKHHFAFPAPAIDRSARSNLVVKFHSTTLTCHPMPKTHKSKVGRRGFLQGAVAGAAGLAAKSQDGSAQEHDHDHDHQTVPSDPALRTKALETLLVQKGLVDTSAPDSLVDAYQTKIGPQNGARVVARAWADPSYKKRLLENSPKAIAELGYT